MGHVAFDCNGLSGDCYGFVGVAKHCGKEFKGGNIGGDVVATIHHVLVVFGGHFVKIDDLLWVDWKVLEVGAE